QRDFIGVFPNFYIALSILLTLPVTVAARERSFSKLKSIKNHLRSSMIQDRLNSLALNSVENEICDELAFDDIVNEFAIMKFRK
ncbi:hypothetical protein L798_07789, partial [Zootermopsis nevadensis]